MSMWMIRAGKSAAYVDEFRSKNIVAIGWPQLGDLRAGTSRDNLVQLATETYPNHNKNKIAHASGQLFRFLTEIKVGDRVVSYDPGQRIYLLGTIKSEPRFVPQELEDMPRVRDVSWESEVSRDVLSVATKNSLGSISTLFLIPDAAATELEAAAKGDSTAAQDESEHDDSDDLIESVRDQSREYIKDRINKLDAYELQDLVAGVLRAMGYKTRVAPPGSDRGIDILASRDGFGFEPPRIVVECKHRQNQAMGSQQVRSFLGGRHKDDKGLFVSTGGFTKDARYEAERASIPLTLMDLDQLVDAVVEHYEQMDSEVRVLLPLTKIYWPLVV